jgi:hypothetical protein
MYGALKCACCYNVNRGRHSGDRMIVGFIATYALSAYSH